MEYIGHLKGERTQLLIEHLKGTAELCESFAAKFGMEWNGINPSAMEWSGMEWNGMAVSLAT